MIYSNSDRAALLAMERDRTGDYGNDGYGEDKPILPKCPNCGASTYYTGQAEEFFKIGGKIIGCNVCVTRIDVYGEDVA